MRWNIINCRFTRFYVKWNSMRRVYVHYNSLSTNLMFAIKKVIFYIQYNRLFILIVAGMTFLFQVWHGWFKFSKWIVWDKIWTNWKEKCEQLFQLPLDWGDQEYIRRWWPGYVECVTVWESLEDGVPYLLCDVCSLYYIKHTLASI